MSTKTWVLDNHCFNGTSYQKSRKQLGCAFNLGATKTNLVFPFKTRVNAVCLILHEFFVCVWFDVFFRCVVLQGVLEENAGDDMCFCQCGTLDLNNVTYSFVHSVSFAIPYSLAQGWNASQNNRKKQPSQTAHATSRWVRSLCAANTRNLYSVLFGGSSECTLAEEGLNLAFGA